MYSNCFGLLRFIAASFVLAGHHWTLSGLPFTGNLLHHLLSLGALLFFAVSGHLTLAMLSWFAVEKSVLALKPRHTGRPSGKILCACLGRGA